MNLKLVVLITAIIFASILVFLAVTKRKTGFVLVMGLGFLVSVALGWQVLNKRYPYQGVLNPQRLGDSLAIMLGTDTALSRFQPESVLKVEHKTVPRASFPVIDIHWHLESQLPEITPERLVQAMDAAGVSKIVHLGSLPGDFESFAKNWRDRYPDRIVMFARPDFNAAFASDDGIEQQVRWIETAARLGARGLKVAKSFGTWNRDQDGNLVPIDDPRLDPIWNKAAELGMPVLIHTSDPTAFFLPPDEHNERLEEMRKNPQWVRYGKGGPSKEELLAQRNRLIARHPNVNFIGAHVGCEEDDLASVAELLDRYPNYYVDIAAVVHALGRQPYTARQFFVRYQDRILFGTDGGYGLHAAGPNWTPERLFESYFEFLETSNEYVDYPMADISKQGRWRVYGLNLPPEVLEKIYSTNAQRLVPTDEQVTARLEVMPTRLGGAQGPSERE